MATKKRTKKRSARRRVGAGELMTLSELARRSGVSLPTLQRYKRSFQDRIPSQGKGRSQRYPAAAVAAVQAIKAENVARRGGRRQRGAANAQGLLPLIEIARQAGISYPTARKYAAAHSKELRYEGDGRSRRYGAETVQAFRELRSRSSRGPKPAAKGRGKAVRRGRPRGNPRTATVSHPQITARVRQLEMAQREISRQLQEVIDALRRPIQVTIEGR